jgi:cytochrome c biogenesis protein
MGYLVFYDWTIPWMLSACVVAVLSMGWHFWRKFAAKPWNREIQRDDGN